MPIHTKFVSWQPEHPPVTPEWICAVVGIGVANAVPGAVLVDEAGTMAPGVVPRWQVSQVVDDGMCDVTPTGVVCGMTTMAVTPVKLAPVIVGPWQAAQLLVMPLWLISEPLNFAPLGTGVVAMLEPAPTWQTSHDAAVGVGFGGGPPLVKFAAGNAKPPPPAPRGCEQVV